jgi:hypothetical protein
VGASVFNSLIRESPQSVNPSDADFVQVASQIGGIVIDPVGAGHLEYVLPVTARKEATPRARARRPASKIPHTISHHNRLTDGNSKTLGGREEEIRIRLGVRYLVPRDDGDARFHSQGFQTGNGSLLPSARRDGPGDPRLCHAIQQFARAG